MTDINHKLIELELATLEIAHQRFSDDVIDNQKMINEAEFRMARAKAHRGAVDTKIKRLTALLNA